LTNFDKTAVSFSRATASILLELELISAAVIAAAVYSSLYLESEMRCDECKKRVAAV
jgi:hypothetical protein